MYIESEIQKSLSCKKSIFQRHEISKNILKKRPAKPVGLGGTGSPIFKKCKKYPFRNNENPNKLF